MQFATRYNPPKSKGIEFVKPSRAQQHFKDECDINNIIAQFEQTGVLPQGQRQPLFGDFAGIPQDFLSSQQLFADAQERFYQLDSGLRREFHNNPAEMLQFMANPMNADKAYDFGLINKPVGYDDRHKPSVQSQSTVVKPTSVHTQETSPASPSADKA